MGEKYLSKTIPVLAVLSALVITQQTLGQIADNFSDGNFTSNPAWTGTTANYIVNGAGRLQLNAPAAGSSYLSLPFSIPTTHNAQWEFAISQNFAPSNQNLSRVYLMADAQDPTAAQNGYYLQFGETGSNDPIDLFKLSSGSAVSILRGTVGSLAAAFNIRVRVTRSSTGSWEIFADNSGGTNFLTQGTVVDNTITSSAYFIVRSIYTVTNVTNFSFDDFSVTTAPAPDVSAPSISSISPLTSTEIQMNFSETLDVTHPLNPNQFIVNDTVIAVSAIFVNSNTSIKITLDEAMVNGRTQKIQYPSISDPSANTLNGGNQNFLFFQPVAEQEHDILINEIYADPTPSVGLPEFEFVELYNRSQHPFQLSGWQLTDGTTVATLTSRILLPGEFLTITPNTAAMAYASFGPVMGVATFPSLNNSGDNVQLKSPAGIQIDAQSYSSAWYGDDDKDAGGYSLELIDPTNFCKGSGNWRASTHAIGGTPGQRNATWQVTPDVIGPKLLEAIPKTSKSITLKFDERMAATVPPLENFSFDRETQKAAAAFSSSAFTEIDLTFSADLDSSVVYTFTLSGFFDCIGNPLQSDFSSGSFRMDMIKPIVESVQVISQSEIEVYFSEKIKPESVAANAFVVEQLAGEMVAALSPTEKHVTITFTTPLVNGRDYSLAIAHITDLAGNVINSESRTFRFFLAQPVTDKDVVINELLADPSPVVALPEGEFIEIYNRSDKAHNLQGWKITDGSTTATLPDKVILPDEYLILCPATLAPQFANFGASIGLSNFPSLNNSGDMLKLIDAEGQTIDSVHYSFSWYQDDNKEDGGWTLERINPDDFCGQGENWQASVNEFGGTPGKANSILADTKDEISPDLLTVSVLSTDSMVIHFSERLSKNAIAPTHFAFDPQLPLDTIFFTSGEKKDIALKLTTALDSVTAYQIRVRDILDCPGNALHPDSSMLMFKLDNVLPYAVKVFAKDATTVSVTFSEKIKHEEIDLNNFRLDDASPTGLQFVDKNKVELIFNPPLINGRTYLLHTTGVSDLAGNVVTQSAKAVLFFSPMPVNRKDVIISEIFPDPSPVIGLPETEYLEIYNRSENPIQLKNWTLADGSHVTRMPDHILLPNNHLLLTTSSKAFQFKNAIGVASFPGLTNGGEPLVLKDSTGVTIDSVYYSHEWYHDLEKQDGGWSLEIIDANNICSEGENWTSSTDPSGGTPGMPNSVMAEKPDLTPPDLVSAFSLSADTVIVEFNEKLAKQLPTVDQFIISPSLAITAISFVDRSLRSYALVTATDLALRTQYRIRVKDVSDCAGNVLPTTQELFFAVAENAETGDVVINEVLFNPRPTGVDFVELFNRSEKYINLKNWQLANLVNDTLVNRKTVSSQNLIIGRQEYLAVTPEPNVLKGEYLQGQEEKFLKASLPTLSDDEGSVALLSEEETIVDTILYSDDQHSPFLKNTEGVSLERIDPNSPSATTNWTSASASSGYATPALPNSNAFQTDHEETVSVDPEIFSPQSGSPDFATIAYSMEHGGYVANIKVIDQQGRIVKTLVENELLGLEGFFKWYGDTSQGMRAANGAYMVWVELFDSSGNIATIKKRIVVAERF